MRSEQGGGPLVVFLFVLPAVLMAGALLVESMGVVSVWSEERNDLVVACESLRTEWAREAVAGDDDPGRQVASIVVGVLRANGFDGSVDVDVNVDEGGNALFFEVRTEETYEGILGGYVFPEGVPLACRADGRLEVEGLSVDGGFSGSWRLEAGEDVDRLVAM